MVCFPRPGQLATCGIASKRLPVSAALWPLLGSVAASSWVLASTCAAFALLWSLARLVRSKGGQVQGEDAQGMWEGPAAAVVMEGIMNYFRCFVGIELEFHLSQSTTTARTSPPPRPPSSPTRYEKKSDFFFVLPDIGYSMQSSNFPPRRATGTCLAAPGCSARLPRPPPGRS